MSKIQEVKERAEILNVVNYFNIKLNRACKGLCPFHNEKTASFSINVKKQIWHCFGCGKGGDVISLVSELLNINAYESAKQVNQICNCGIDFNTPTNKYDIEKYKHKQKMKEEFKKWVDDTENILLDCFRIVRNKIIDSTDFEELKTLNNDFSHIESLIYKLENYPVLFWKYERKRVKEFEKRYKQ